MAHALSATPAEVCFVCSGTEAAALAVLCRALVEDGGRIIVGATEHQAVLRAARLSKTLGCRVDVLPVDANGRIAPEEVERALERPARLVCVMHANNQTGALQPVAEIARICSEHQTVFFCDTVQTFGVLPLPDADMLAVSAHNIYGPKGVDALRIRPRARLQPISYRGGQERERRAGTENLLGIVGLAAATLIFDTQRAKRLQQLRNRFETILLESSIGVRITSAEDPRHPGISHVTIQGVSAVSILIRG